MASKFFSFFTETKQELSKVNWPSREELVQSTWLVIVVTMILAGFIAIFDLIFSYLVRIVLG